MNIRLNQVPGIKVSPCNFVEFKVTSKRHPEQNQAFQHTGDTLLKDFMRVAYWINLKEATFKFYDKQVECFSGKDYYLMEFI